LTTPSLSQSAFGTMQTGVTQLVVDVNLEDDYKLGISDMRGDGRPDFSYEARVLYADTISPARASVHNSTPITITGFGFSPTTTAMVWNERGGGYQSASRAASHCGSSAF
jgi:hypothetical protein